MVSERNFAPDYLDSVEELYGDTQAGAVIKYLRAALEASHAPVRDALQEVVDAYMDRFADGKRLLGPIDEEIKAARKILAAGTTPEPKP